MKPRNTLRRANDDCYYYIHIIAIVQRFNVQGIMAAINDHVFICFSLLAEESIIQI